MDDIAELALNPKTKQLEKLQLYQKNTRFKCQRCAIFCCKLGGPELSEKDVQRLKKIKDNASDCLDTRIPFRNKEDGSCVFLRFDAEKRIYECSVYDHRPTLCRLYPFLAERSGLNSYTLKLIPCCSGLNTKDGELVNENFIRVHLLDALFDLSCV